MNFPFPFKGITNRVLLPVIALEQAVSFLINGCNQEHKHNFAVEMDTNNKYKKGYIYTSDQGIKCVQEGLLIENDEDSL